jgi:hypothetical protein
MRVGDVVKQKDSGTLMTVIRLLGDGHDEEGSGNFFKSMDRRFEMQGFDFGDPTCVWFEETLMKQGVYHSSDLDIVNIAVSAAKTGVAAVAGALGLGMDEEADDDLDDLDFELDDLDLDLNDDDFDLGDLDLDLGNDLDLGDLDLDLGDDLDLDNLDLGDLDLGDDDFDLDLDLGLDDNDLDLDGLDLGDDLGLDDFDFGDDDFDLGDSNDEVSSVAVTQPETKKEDDGDDDFDLDLDLDV